MHCLEDSDSAVQVSEIDICRMVVLITTSQCLSTNTDCLAELQNNMQADTVTSVIVCNHDWTTKYHDLHVPSTAPDQLFAYAKSVTARSL